MPPVKMRGDGRKAKDPKKPEKALLDLLYLYPFYDNEEELERLKLDENFITKRLDVERLGNYLGQMRNKALDSRVRKLLKIYDL